MHRLRNCFHRSDIHNAALRFQNDQAEKAAFKNIRRLNAEANPERHSRLADTVSLTCLVTTAKVVNTRLVFVLTLRCHHANRRRATQRQDQQQRQCRLVRCHLLSFLLAHDAVPPHSSPSYHCFITQSPLLTRIHRLQALPPVSRPPSVRARLCQLPRLQVRVPLPTCGLPARRSSEDRRGNPP